MNKIKRAVYLIVSFITSSFSTILFIDTYSNYHYFLEDIIQNWNQILLWYMLITFLLSISGFISVYLNFKLITGEPYKRKSDNNIIDDFGSTTFFVIKWLFYSYLSFAILLITLGILIVGDFILKIIENPSSQLNEGVAFFGIISISLGIIFFKDCLKLRAKKEHN